MDDAGTITALACAISRFLKEGELTGSWRSSGPCCKESVPNTGKATLRYTIPPAHGLPAALDLDAETRPVLEPDAEVQLGGLKGRFQFVDLGLAVALGGVPAPVWCGPVHAGLGSRPGGGGLSDQRVPGSDAAAVAQSGGLPALREEERLFHPPGGTAPEAAQKAYEQAERQAWRALLLVIKAKLEAVEADITSIEQEFLPNMVLPDNTTVGENMLPRLREIVASGHLPLMLPAAHPIALGPPTQ